MLIKARNQTLTENVIDQLLYKIRDGAWRPGEFLPSERLLMQSLGVGRSCIREALQSLATLGLIEIRAGRGARVKAMSTQPVTDPALSVGILASDDLLPLWEVRVSLEVAAVRIATQRVEPQDLDLLDVTLSAMAQQVGISDLPGYIERDLEFHQQLVAVAHNPVFSQLYGFIYPSVCKWVRRLGTSPSVMVRGLACHKAVSEALKAGDPDAAETAMRIHLGGRNRWPWALDSSGSRNQSPGDTLSFLTLRFQFPIPKYRVPLPRSGISQK